MRVMLLGVRTCMSHFMLCSCYVTINTMKSVYISVLGHQSINARSWVLTSLTEQIARQPFRESIGLRLDESWKFQVILVLCWFWKDWMKSLLSFYRSSVCFRRAACSKAHHLLHRNFRLPNLRCSSVKQTLLI